MTRQEFLDEMVAYYSEDTNRRAVIRDPIDGHTTSCQYKNYDCGTACAIGRYIPDAKYNYRIEGDSVAAPEILALLPEEIQRMGAYFLGEVQNLHDIDACWDKNGLTVEGHRRYECIKRHILRTPVGWEHPELAIKQKVKVEEIEVVDEGEKEKELVTI